jgi:hypothetical protein
MNATASRMGPLQIGILLLGLATAIIHLTLVFPSPMFILNGLGYLALLAAYFLPMPVFQNNRNLVRWVFIAYTAITVIAWIAIGERYWLGYVDKAIEVLLIVLLFLDNR